MQKFRISVGLDAFTLSHTCTYRLLCTSHKNTGHIVVSTAMVTPPLHNQRVDLVKVSFLPALSFQCSRSCGSGIQKRELRCGERDSQGGYVPSTAHSDALHSGICGIAVSIFSKLQCSGGEVVFQPTNCPLPHRYVEFPVRRCRNIAKPLVDLQQVCNRGPCPELPRAVPGRTSSGAVTLGWYPSPWQQVHQLRL